MAGKTRGRTSTKAGAAAAAAASSVASSSKHAQTPSKTLSTLNSKSHSSAQTSANKRAKVDAEPEPAGRPTAEIISDTRRVLASIDPYASPYHPRHRPEDHIGDAHGSEAASEKKKKGRRSSTAAAGSAAAEGQDADSKNEIIGTSLSLAAFKAEMIARSGESAKQESRKRSSMDGRQGTTAALAADAAADSTARQLAAADVDWQMYRDWPEGVSEEEEAMRTYFQRLKFIYLETATKLTFLNDCTQEMIHNGQSLAALEAEAARAKEDLRAGKASVRALRTGIDEAADAMLEPYAQLEKARDEAQALIASIRDMELELAQIRATTGSSGSTAARALAQGGSTANGSESEALSVAPKLGTLTLEEAEAFNEAQLVQMQVLHESTARAQAAVKEKQKQLEATARAVQRLNHEWKNEERYAEEVKESNRDREVEQLCEGWLERINQLKSILGITAIDAPNETELRISYLSTGSAEPTKLVLQYDAPGGRLQSYCVVKPDDTDADIPEDNVPLLEAAFAANDAPALIQELWRAMQSMPVAAAA